MMNNELENIKSRFKSYLPEFILKAPYLKEIFNSEIIESYYLNQYVRALLNELCVSTTTENIDKWEKFVGLNNENLDLKQRIDTVIKKFSFQIHANHFNFLSMLKSFDKRTELEEFINEYRILIKTYTPMGYANLLNFMDIIHNYKPAHIGFNLEIYRDIYINFNEALIFQNTKYANINIKPYSDKLRTNTYMVSLANKIKNKKINIKFNIRNQGNYLNSLVLNRTKVREVHFSNISKFKNFSSNGIIINTVKIRRCTIE